MRSWRIYAAAILLVSPAGGAVAAEEQLPSRNAGSAREAIVSFDDKITHEGSMDFVPPDERIAVFDNDGTLWAEKPVYFQLALPSTASRQ